jgi:ubiquitin-activating enzyme E1
MRFFFFFLQKKIFFVAVKIMNPSLNIAAHETPVGKNTENVFDDNFWESLDLVVNGLDNIQARL